MRRRKKGRRWRRRRVGRAGRHRVSCSTVHAICAIPAYCIFRIRAPVVARAVGFIFFVSVAIFIIAIVAWVAIVCTDLIAE